MRPEPVYTLTLTNDERVLLMSALEDYQSPTPERDKQADGLYDRLQAL